MRTISKKSQKLAPLFVFSSLLGVGLPQFGVYAQVIPDSTLGSENSVVTPDVIRGIPSDRIDGGAVRGTNLFQSFQEFKVGEGRGAYFSNPVGIANIFSRVTGGNISQILGTLGVLGNANLYFLNPNGIVFGPNAQLDIKGSFLATTADSFQFPNSYAFSAVNPDAPPLLTVNIPVGLNFRANSPATISNQGNLMTDQDLTLSGGDLEIQGQLQANKNLSLNAQNNINIQNNLTQSLGMGGTMDINALGDININNSTISVNGGDRGGIMIDGNNLNINGKDTQIKVSIDDKSEIPNYQAGNINIYITDKLLINGAIVTNLVSKNGQGNAGNIIIKAGSLFLNNDAQINTNSEGQGNAGNINLIIEDLVKIDGNHSGIFSNVQPHAIANSGKILISAGALRINNGGSITTNNFGQGNGGDININVREYILLDGAKLNKIFNGIASVAFTENPGNSGDITIKTDSLKIVNGGLVSGNNYGTGSAGNINIIVDGSIFLDIFGEDQFYPTGIVSIVFPKAKGNPGIISISSNSLKIAGGAIISTTSFGKGNGGSIIIDTRDSLIIDGNDGNKIYPDRGSGIYSRVGIFPGASELAGVGNAGDILITTGSLQIIRKGTISASTLGNGNSGSVNINAKDKILIDQEGQIESNVNSTAKGNAKGLYINADSLIINNGGRVTSDTYGKGNAGNVQINIKNAIVVDGEGQLLSGTPPYRLPSIISSVVFPGAEGNAKGISINTGSLNVTNGGIITSSTFAKGNADNVNIKASGSILLEGKARNPLVSIGADNVGSSGIFTLVLNRSSGQAGNISIAADSLRLADGGTVNASTTGSGNAGVIIIDANSLDLVNQSAISSIVHNGATGTAGNILIKVNKSLSLNDNAQIRAFTQGTGDAGSIFIDSPQASIRFSNDSNISVASGLGAGAAGDLTIRANSLTLDQSSLTAETYNNLQLSGANIDLNLSDRLTLTNDSKITATAFESANGGNIEISSPFLIAFPSTGANGNDVIAKAFLGNGGKIQIDAQGIFGITEGKVMDGNQTNDIDASSEFGASGVVQINRAIDPNRGLVSLPVNVVDPNALISQNPCKRGKESQLSVKGRSGLPPSLTEDFSSSGTEVNWVEPVPMSNNSSNHERIEANTEVKPRIEPAQGWIFNKKGQVMLIGYNTQTTENERSPLPAKGCPVEK